MMPRAPTSPLFPCTTLFRSSFTIAVTDVAPTTPTDSDGATGGSISEGASTGDAVGIRSEEHTTERQSHSDLVSRLPLEQQRIAPCSHVATAANAALLEHAHQ